jgi:hypothetical protein
MGFLPFVNQGGTRVVRWHRLALVWLFVLLACMAGAGAASYLLTDDAWHYGIDGIFMGVFLSAVVTVGGFLAPVEKLPLGA